MQPIDSKSLDTLFNNPGQEAHRSFMDINKEVFSGLKAISVKVADQMLSNSATNSIKTTATQNIKAATAVQEKSFDRVIKEKEDNDTNKTKDKKTKKQDDDKTLLLVNQVSTQVLEDVEYSLNLNCEANKEINPLSVEICKAAPNAQVESNSDLSKYEKDSSDIGINLIPFSNFQDQLKLPKDPTIEPPLELKLAVLTEMSDTLTTQVEDLTKSIANIDLNSESGVENILQLSNQIENLSQINDALKAQIDAAIKAIDNKATVINSASDLSKTILNPESKTLVDARLEKFIETVRESKLEPDSTSKSQGSTSEAKIQQEVDYRSKMTQSLSFKDRIELIEFKTAVQENVDASKEARATANESSSLIRDIKLSGNASNAGSGADSNKGKQNNSQQTAIQALQETSGTNRLASSRMQIITKSIPMERLTNFVAEKATAVPQGVKQELKLFLNPENMGGVELSIAKDGNKLDIKLVFSNEEAMRRVDHKMNELKILLKSRGFESNIELSQSSTNNSDHMSNQHNANTGAGSYNQAREEQKQKFLDRPNWLDEDISSEEPSFDETFEGITN